MRGWSTPDGDDPAAPELGYLEAGHLEVAQNQVQRLHGLVGLSNAASLTEDHVQILVCRILAMSWSATGMRYALPAVRNPGCQLLELTQKGT